MKSCKNSKLKKLKQRTIACEYLSNISLNGSLVNERLNETKNLYYDKLISNKFDCFLSFNKINQAPGKQSEFFNYYKQKLINENPGSTRTNEFFNSEFKEISLNCYLSKIFNKNKKLSNKKLLTNIPSINIVPSLTFTNSPNDVLHLHNKASMSDAESEYLKSVLSKTDQNQTLAQIANSNVTISSNSSISSSNKLSTSFNGVLKTKMSQKRTSKSPKENEIDELNDQINTRIVSKNTNSNHTKKYQRTISESSNESCNPLNSSSKNLGSFHSNTVGGNLNKLMTTNQSGNNYKPSLFNNLKRLTNEKILLTCNNSPIGVFSRLPFRLNQPKSEQNDSFLIAKSRHMSINKSGLNQSNFIVDVFDLLDLDFDEYANSGSMSYADLIDPISKKRSFEESQQAEQNDESIEEDIEDLKSLKKEYQADYLDDPQLTELTAGKNRTCLKFASYAVSIIDYVKPLDLKKEINETFKEKFPNVQISLTKLRSIKKELLEIGYETNLDLIIVAQSYIYFEKLILKGLINKTNRKYLAANCLMISAKLNDVSKKDLNKLFENIMNKFRFDSRKEVILYEFGILVALEFNLVIKYEHEFLSHYERLVNNLDSLKLNNNNDESRNRNNIRTLSD